MNPKHGSFGRPGGELPAVAESLIDGMHEHLNRDWSMSGGWIAVRTWETPQVYRIVVARVAHQTEWAYADRGGVK